MTIFEIDELLNKVQQAKFVTGQLLERLAIYSKRNLSPLATLSEGVDQQCVKESYYQISQCRIIPILESCEAELRRSMEQRIDDY